MSSTLSRPKIFTIISSDFCHWGSRFGYSPTSPDNGDENNNKTHNNQRNDRASTTTQFNEIHEFIEWLDRQGMEKISLQDPGAFAIYMKQYRNTICGRYPIALYLNALTKAKERGDEEVSLVFVKYDQSSRVKKLHESSVSYASAVARNVV